MTWLTAAAIALHVVVGVLCVPVLVLLCQVLAARRDATAEAIGHGDPDRRPSVAVLVPAHDEASGIAASLATVVPQLHAGDRLVVVADNCGDATADVAASCGAGVVERRDPERRGKGYALDFGVRHLERSVAPPAIVIVVDADCAVAAGSIDVLARACARRGTPVQALYLMLAPPGAGLKLRMAEFAWAVRNEVRARGAQRLGGPCQLMGTGMAFPWPTIAGASLASGHIVEDMQLGVDLALAGTPPAFVAQALVTSRFPDTDAGAAAQRKRWEHGHLATLLGVGPRLLWSGLVRGRPSVCVLALDLMIPPLALLLLVLTAVCACAGLAAVGGTALPLSVASALLVLMAAAILFAWAQVGRRSVTLTELCAAPLYMLAKIPMYLRLVTDRQLRWVRTGRDQERR